MESRKLAVVIDDEEFIRTLLERVFDSLGYETILFASASEVPCINLDNHENCPIKNRTPDVLISDILMPGLSGLDFMKKLKERGCKIEKTALMTGFSNQTLDESCKDLRCKAFTKPFTINQIKEWLEE